MNMDPNCVYVEQHDISLEDVLMVNALPVVPVRFIDDLRRLTGILCLCKRTSKYYESRVEKITGNGDNRTFRIHFKNYGKKQDQVFSVFEAMRCFLPHTIQTMKYAEKYNKNIHSAISKIAIQERVTITPRETSEGVVENAVPVAKKALPDVSRTCIESLKALAEIDNGCRLLTHYPPRYCIEQILKEFQASTKMFNYFNEVTMNRFCSIFESSYMFSTPQTVPDYEMNAAFDHYMEVCKIRDISVTHKEVDLKFELFGKWKAGLDCRYLYGVVQLVRYISSLYYEYDQIEQERNLVGQEHEMMLLITQLGHYIYQNREKYFSEGRDYTQPTAEDIKPLAEDMKYVNNNDNF